MYTLFHQKCSKNKIRIVVHVCLVVQQSRSKFSDEDIKMKLKKIIDSGEPLVKKTYQEMFRCGNQKITRLIKESKEELKEEKFDTFARLVHRCKNEEMNEIFNVKIYSFVFN